MSMLTRLGSWWHAMTHRDRLESEMDAELRFHMDSYVEDQVRTGVALDEARRRARLELGGIEVQKQECRESVGLRPWDELRADLVYGWRVLRKSPGFTVVAVASLALGIGANTAIFTVAKKVLLDTLPVKDPLNLRMLTWVSGHEQPVPPVWGDVSPTENGGLSSNAFSYPVLEQLRKRSDVFQDLVAFKDLNQLTVTVDGHPEVVPGEVVSGNAFTALRVGTILGRTLTPTDDAGPGRGPVAVINESYWNERFSRSPSVLGTVIHLNGVAFTVVGVSPRSFTGLKMGQVTQIFVPLTMQPLLMPRPQASTISLLDNPRSWWVLVLARLRPDVPEARAEAVLDLAMRQAAMATLPRTPAMDHFHLKLAPGGRGLDYLQGRFAGAAYVLLALAGLVLMLACVNLANLLLARASARKREMSTRMALGAGRMRILRQVLTESLLLSAMGGAMGLVLGYLFRNAIPRLLEDPWRPNSLVLYFDWRVLAFTVAVSLMTGILFGIVPAWQATRSDVNSDLKNAGHSTATRQNMWLGKGLVIVQVALSSILLIGAGLFVRTLINLGHTPLGFRADHILMFQLNPPRTRYSDEQMVSLYSRLEEKVGAIPGVRSVSMSNIAIVGDGNSGSTLHVSGAPVKDPADRVQTNSVGYDFFPTMGIPILRGRGFSLHDNLTAPRVAVVNQALARQFFPHQDPIGRTFEADADDSDGPLQIVGVAADTRYADLRTATPPTFYAPYRQRVRTASRMVVEIRTAGEPGSVLSAVRAVMESLDRDLPMIDVRTQEQQVKATMAGERIFAQLTGVFGILALVLASIGIYGIMAYTVARRTSEIGIRMALGARAGQVLWMVLREASWMAVAGVVLGTMASVWCFRLVSAMLFGLSASDPAVLGGASLLLIAIALLAGFGPARKASCVDPIQALRHE